ncbi:unnamed protein product [Dracunculus medinensis]|uniref:FMRFamide-related neuropeptide n=1 Tax=Dracunculus medinensis TaxID=318479 RepID=A0A0N4U596_DRAME|nr:unnamed protein product [Dracunculus medinensis]
MRIRGDEWPWWLENKSSLVVGSVCSMQQITVIALFFSMVLAIFVNGDNVDDLLRDKRAMRNALVRLGRSSMRNALIRFGKRSVDTDLNDQAYGYKRNGAPQPFVRFGRSQRLHDILSEIETAQSTEKR